MQAAYMQVFNQTAVCNIHVTSYNTTQYCKQWLL